MPAPPPPASGARRPATRAPADLFAGSVYTKGALTLQALREKIGDRAFFRLLRAWYVAHRDGTATTDDFVALAERIAHRQLDTFFRIWLYTPGKPTSW